MKVKALIDCTGVGYENFKEGEVRDLKKELAEVLISYDYAEKATDKAVK